MALITGHTIHRGAALGSAIHNGTWGAIIGEAGCSPDQITGCEVVASNGISAGGDDLSGAFVLSDGRGCPGVAFVAIFLPESFAAFGIETFNGRLPRVITNEDELSVVHHRRTPFTETGSHFCRAEVSLPEFFSVEGVGIKSCGTEPAIDSLTVAE